MSHILVARPQRGENAHPGGRLTNGGVAPGMEYRRLPRLSMLGNESISPRV